MLITNAVVVTYGGSPRILADHAILVRNGIIEGLGLSRELIAQFPDEQQIDARGQLVMPGNICAHTHFYGAYARGMGVMGEPAENFPQILERLWWPLDRALDRESVRLSTQVALIDAIKHGTTMLIDHHSSPNFITGSLDVIANAVTAAGLRAVLCYETTSRNGLEKLHEAVAENLRFMAASVEHPRIAGTFGLHASMTLDDQALQLVRDSLPSGAGFHIHAAEHEADQEDSVRRSGARVLHRLNQFGILGDRTIAAHCIHIDKSEMALLRDTGTWVTHQARSNMNNGVGAMAFDQMSRYDIRLCLGSDGFFGSMWSEWQAAYFLHKVVNRDPRAANGAVVADVAVQHNARLAEQFFSRIPHFRLGEISVGARADLIIVDYHPFTPLTADNLAWHILFGFDSGVVTSTIVDGVMLMRDRVLLTLDEDAILQEARAAAPEVWARYRQQAQYS